MSFYGKFRRFTPFRQFEVIKDIIGITKISGTNGLWKLLNHSLLLKRYGRNFAIMNSLIALEKCDLNKVLLSENGLDVFSQEKFDLSTLSTICEYMYEVNILEMISPGIYRAKNKSQYESLLHAMYACYAYHEPVQAMDKLLTKEYQYGEHVVRNDEYDAIASANLTSKFSYGFSKSVLDKINAESLMDLGCGTGEFLFFLKKNYFPGRLYGMDISESAIAKGKESGFEREKTELFTGDIFDLYNSVSKINLNSVEIFSFMFVLHEFDDGQVKTILKTIKDHYPKSKILLTELINKSSQETRKHNRTVFPELKFVHQLSKQILRTPTEWKELFSEADFRATIEVTSKLTNQVCLLFTQG